MTLRRCCYEAREGIAPPCPECQSLLESDLFNHDRKGSDFSEWEPTDRLVDINLDPSQFFDAKDTKRRT